jgi:hypothetical protein
MPNYCDKIKCRIYATEKTDFRQMIDDLLAQIKPGEAVLRLVFFGSPATNEAYIAQQTILREKVAACYPDGLPALSYVAQPPLNASLVVEVHSFVRKEGDPEEEAQLSYREYEGVSYVLLTNKDGRFVYAGGVQRDIRCQSVEEQAKGVFERIGGLLALHRFPIHGIVRQWNYIEQITGFQDRNQNYQSFNNARSAFYEKTGWPDGYPSATGIGTKAGGVSVDFDAAMFTSPDAFSTPVNNKLQIAAHAYSENVLKEAKSRKATPKFERAKSMTFGGRRFVYISGTAAIRGEESPKDVGLAKQLHITMENIAQLTGNADLQMLRVYLKDPEDYLQAQELMQSYRLSVPISYVCADVCRDELLIEIEGIAME